MDFPVHEFNGRAIQAAIDAAFAAGGGRVVLSNGSYRCGTLYLKSNVELHLPSGARIEGGSSPDDYDDFFDPACDCCAPEGSRKVLIVAAHAENIAITGSGVIDGMGPCFYDTNVPAGSFFAKPPHPRPRMIQFLDCRFVRLEGVLLKDSPGWTVWLPGCEFVRIHALRIDGCQQMINNDGIDIDDCRNVTISDCTIKTGDDCLVLRAIVRYDGHQPLCRNVVVTNCTLNSRCQAIRVGCPSDGTITDCAFSNLTLRGANGINVNNPRRYLREGCSGNLYLDRISFDHLTMECDNVPVWINVEEGVKLRRLGGLAFSNLQIRARQPILLDGTAETPITDVSFRGVNAELEHDKVFEAHCVRNLRLDDVRLSCF